MVPKTPKTPKTEGEGKASTAGLNDREGRMISFVLKSLPSTVRSSIDFEALAAEFGQKDVRAAQDSFRYLCKKYGWFEGSGSTANAPSTPTPKKSAAKPASTKRALPLDESAVDESPSKKTRSVRSKKAAPSEESFIKMENLNPEDIDLDLAQGMA